MGAAEGGDYITFGIKYFFNEIALNIIKSGNPGTNASAVVISGEIVGGGGQEQMERLWLLTSCFVFSVYCLRYSQPVQTRGFVFGFRFVCFFFYIFKRN